MPVRVVYLHHPQQTSFSTVTVFREPDVGVQIVRAGGYKR